MSQIISGKHTYHNGKKSTQSLYPLPISPKPNFMEQLGRRTARIEQIKK